MTHQRNRSVRKRRTMRGGATAIRVIDGGRRKRTNRRGNRRGSRRGMRGGQGWYHGWYPA